MDGNRSLRGAARAAISSQESAIQADRYGRAEWVVGPQPPIRHLDDAGHVLRVDDPRHGGELFGDVAGGPVVDEEVHDLLDVH
ncbi:hypothetical protein PV410_40530 [Streptomyces sp. PA03-5A]|nr:hypothetical protein [Streptomyces sp. PA03-5A]